MKDANWWASDIMTVCVQHQGLPPSNKIAAIVEAIQADAQPTAGWMPIETAPRDGTQLLLCTVQNGIHIDSYSPKYWKGEIGPLGWMPLPPPPSDGKTDDNA